MSRMARLATLVMFSLAATTAAAAISTTVVYRCNGGRTVSARYDTSSPSGGVVLTYDGQVLSLQSAVSASGARYTTRHDPHSITPLEWWNKGRGATLSELAQGSVGASRLITTCRQSP